MLASLQAGLMAPALRRAKAILQASTSGTGRTHCEPQSRWPFLVDENDQALAAGDAGVEHISLQHCVFGALALVDCGGIGGNQLVKLTEAVGQGAVVETCALCGND